MDIHRDSPSANARYADTGTPVRFAAAACLPGRHPGETCGLCQAACPAGAIELVDGVPRVGRDCTGCGQCAAACPTSALHVDGFALPSAVHAGLELTVDCWRVPAAESSVGALRVPCLAGIGVGWLIALCDLGGERPIRLLDRGHCHHCAVGKGIANLLERLTEARTLLFDGGVDLDNLPVLAGAPGNLPPVPAIPLASGQALSDRRGFLRGLVGRFAHAAGTLSAPLATESAIVLRDLGTPVDRMRVGIALARIAARHGRPFPAAALPRVAAAQCSGHGICVRVCPTAALSRHQDGKTLELRFQATRCVACGQCARTCPDRALRVEATGGAVVVETLGRWRAVVCDACGGEFFGGAGQTCPDCLRQQQVIQGMATLFQRPPA